MTLDGAERRARAPAPRGDRWSPISATGARAPRARGRRGRRRSARASARRAAAHRQDRHRSKRTDGRFSSPSSAAAAAGRRSARCISARRWRRWRSIAGFDVTIVDPRTAFATRSAFPTCRCIAEWPDEALPQLGARPLHRARRADPRSEDRRSGARTRRSTPTCFYIGALGSRKTHAKRVERLRPLGFDATQISPASTRRSASTSARCRRPRSRCRSSARSSPLRAEAREEARRVKFGPSADRARPKARIAGASVRHGGRVLKKGTRLGGRRRSRAEGRRQSETSSPRSSTPDDVGEDEAARGSREAVAGEACRGRAAFTGRVESLCRDRRHPRRRPRRDRSHQRGRRGDHGRDLAASRRSSRARWSATVKIIPFAVPAALLPPASRRPRARKCAARRALRPPPASAVISTLLPGLKPCVGRQRRSHMLGRSVSSRRMPSLRPSAGAARVEALTRELKDQVAAAMRISSSCSAPRRPIGAT